jgi:hypothetical protein
MEHLDAETTYDHSNLVLVSRPSCRKLHSLITHHSFPPLLSPILFPLVRLCFSPLLTLNLRHQPLILLLIRRISLLLLSQALGGKDLCILSQLSDRALLLSLVLLLQFRCLSASLIWIIVSVWVE